MEHDVSRLVTRLNLLALGVVIATLVAAPQATPARVPFALWLAGLFALTAILPEISERCRWRHWLLTVLALTVVVSVYESLGRLIAACGPSPRDGWILAFERSTLGDALPPLTPIAMPPWLVDALSLAYASYFMLPLLLLGALLRRGLARDAHHATLTLLIAFYMHYAIYAMVPVVGPLRTPELSDSLKAQLAAGGGAVTASLRAVIRRVEGTPQDTFPSAHTSVTFLVVAIAFRHRLAMRWWAAAAAGPIVASTVLLGYHYGVDVLVAAPAACVPWWISRRLARRPLMRKRWSAPGSGSIHQGRSLLKPVARSAKPAHNDRMPPFRSVLTRVVTVAACGVWVQAGQSTRPLPDFARTRDEAVQHLRALIRIDTSNPPGNETRAAQYIKGVLDRDGIASEMFARDAGRATIVARLKGSGRRRPILIMGHTDVVGVEREKWSVDPFAGVIKDGFIYGRGAVDDKDTVAAALVTLLSLHRLRIPLDRDVIFLAEAGEEGTPEVGITYMVEEHWKTIDSEMALAEGGDVPLQGGRIRYVGVATTEKVPNTVRLVARGTSGHGSAPRVDNPIVHLAAAVAKLGAYQPPMRLIETTKAFFERLAAVSPPDEAFLLTHLEDPMVQDTLRRTRVSYNSMLRTSISPNILKGGFRVNVIPGDAEATLDVRALPGENMDAFIAALGRVIDDPAVEIRRSAPNRPSAPPSPLDAELFRALERSARTVFPDVPTIPMMLNGATDMAQLRAKGVMAYGISEPLEGSELLGHGNDERISIDALGQYVEYIYRTVLEVAGAR